jgi:hypothetical protein
MSYMHCHRNSSFGDVDDRDKPGHDGARDHLFKSS